MFSFQQKKHPPFIGWQDRVVLITGASSGIGCALAKNISSLNAKVGILSRSQNELDKIASLLSGEVVAMATDITNLDAVTNTVACMCKKLGRVDMLINCAGAGAFSSFQDTPIDCFEALMKVNYLGAVYTMKAVLPSMLASNHGHIVNIASVAGCFGVPFESAYSASKFALVGMTQAVQQEVKSKGIQMTLVLPGPVNTNFFQARDYPYPFKSPKPMSTEKVAARIITAIEQGKEKVYIPRWLKYADTVQKLFPALYRLGIRQMYRDLFEQQ